MKLKNVFFGTLLLGLITGILPLNGASADERHFTYSYEASVLPKGQWEIEQWVTNENGKEDGDYSQWDLRTEFEYGLTDRLMTAIYLNVESTRSEGVTGEDDENEAKFKGVSSEWFYQLSNPHLDSVGTALYGEVTTDGIDVELEGKFIVSKEFNNIVLAFNAIYEAEWEREDNETEKEATLEFTAGGAYKFDPNWSAGLEVRNKSAYPGDLNLGGQEFQSWSVGPNIHYGDQKWWGTFTILPQVWGNGDGSEGGRQLVHEESIEVRLIFGVLL